MKKLLLFLTVLFLTGTSVEAQNYKNGKRVGYKKHLKMQPVIFKEKGVQFYVLPNGKFKFKKTRKQKDLYYSNNWNYNRKLRIKRNVYGDIIRVGKVNLHYNKKGKVVQIGSVRIKYKHGKMKKIGGLHLVYKPNGRVKYYGNVKYKNWGTYFDERPYFII